MSLAHFMCVDVYKRQQSDKRMWDYRYNIGFWLWELEEFPDEWLPCIQCLDEIWTPSEFISRTIRKKTDKPVITIPYYVEAPITRKYEREDFDLPVDKFLFLMMYDKNSMTERKNPKAVLHAYQRAFQNNEPVGLVIKISNCNKNELQELKKELKEYGNVYFVTDILNRDQVNSCLLYTSCTP